MAGMDQVFLVLQHSSNDLLFTVMVWRHMLEWFGQKALKKWSDNFDILAQLKFWKNYFTLKLIFLIRNNIFPFTCRLNMGSRVKTAGKVSLKDSEVTEEELCVSCNSSVIHVTKAGVCALTFLAWRIKHQKRTRNYNPTANLYFQKGKTNPPSTSTDSANTSNVKVDTMMNSVTISVAEICWVLKVTTSHFFLQFLPQYEWPHGLHVSK